MDLYNILQFLGELSQNNNQGWMKENKEWYLSAKDDFADFVQELIIRISEFDNSVSHLRPSDLIYRLNKDMRFSKIKIPYNTSFRAHISSAQRQPIPAGYYINIQPSSSFLGGGIFATQFPEATTMIRDQIIEKSGDFQSIINDKTFTANFTVEGNKLKNVPKGYDKEHTLAEFLKHKSWDIEYHMSDEQLLENDISFIVEKFRQMKPFNDFLNTAVQDFKIPQRR